METVEYVVQEESKDAARPAKLPSWLTVKHGILN
jgi:hypothetical protein